MSIEDEMEPGCVVLIELTKKACVVILMQGGSATHKPYSEKHGL